MASETTNLHLTKPGYDDLADVGVINDNMDAIDAAYASIPAGNIASGILPAARGGTGSAGYGAAKNLDGETVSIANNTPTEVGSISLEAGTWLILAGFNFAANATGARHVSFNATSGSVPYSRINSARVQAPSSGMCLTTVVCTAYPTSTTTYYCNALQNSGGALNCSVYVRAIRLK